MSRLIAACRDTWTMHRRRLRVFLAKNFSMKRYDYREVWLRLSQTLAGRTDDASLPDRSVKALAAIIGSPGGELWLKSTTPFVYDGHGAWQMSTPQDPLLADSALLKFLEKTHWVLDTAEYVSDPARYANAFATEKNGALKPSIVIPLVHESELIGVVRLDRPQGLGDLSFEDHDLLKTAGQQVAIFLMHAKSQEQLAETRQFEAFSKLTAFLMHDLKNMVAQLELVVGNAKRFKHRPDFIDDAVRTMEGSVRRMKRVLERLQEDSGAIRSAVVDLPALLGEACETCADRRPAPRLASIESNVWVTMDRDRLSMAVMHALRNAQDATPDDGHIDVSLSAKTGWAVIEIADSGAGMDPVFIRDRLFKPFDSTKGAKGMGMGAYQIRETLRLANGEVLVTSQLGTGTVLQMRIPLAEPHRAAIATR